MNYKEYAFTASEITQLEYILSIMPESREIERIGLEYRLEKAKQRLEGVPIPPRPILTDVKFQGKPVVDDVGIEASFTGRTTKAFAESTALTVAASTGELKETGAIPDRGLGQQLVSGVTTGSFGFQIELPHSTVTDVQTGQTYNPAERAVEMIQDLLETSLEGGDDDLAELTNRMHPRAVRKVAEFLGILKSDEAQVAIGLNGREVALRNSGEVEKATRRLAERNIEGRTTIMTGTLIGIVPARGFFEFMVSDTGELIEGRIGHEIRDPYRVASRYANQEVRARIRRLQVGQGQPKYTLLEILGPADSPTSL